VTSGCALTLTSDLQRAFAGLEKTEEGRINPMPACGCIFTIEAFTEEGGWHFSRSMNCWIHAFVGNKAAIKG